MKRFTDTEKWNDPWFRKLSPPLKCFWFYVLDNCDSAGVWKVDMELANFVIGGNLTEKEVLAAMPGRFTEMKGAYWHIRKFISYQYGELSEECRPHQPILRLLRSHNLFKEYQKGFQTLKEKEKEKEQEKDKTGEGETEGKPFAGMDGLNRARKLFNKRASTPLDASEKLAWSKARPAVVATTEEQWQLLEWAYAQNNGDVAKYRRQGMATLLNNWNEECDRAARWKRGDKPRSGAALTQKQLDAIPVERFGGNV